MFIEFLTESKELSTLGVEFMTLASNTTKRNKHDAYADAARMAKDVSSLKVLEHKLIKRAEGMPTGERVAYLEAARLVRSRIK